MEAAILYGSCTGKTEIAAENLAACLEPSINIPVKQVADIGPEDLQNFDLLIIGIPTWDIGELEADWQDVYDEMDGLDLSRLTVAFFGLGDQYGYSDTYQDAMGILYEKFIECKATGGIGFTSTDGHTFDESRAVMDGKFCGLALDEDNQDELTEERINTWAQQLVAELTEKNFIQQD